MMVGGQDRQRPVSYGSVGMTAAPDVIAFPPPGFHVVVRQQRIGSGAERFASARDTLFSWGMHSAAGFAVGVTSVGDNDGYQGLRQNADGQWHVASESSGTHFTQDGQQYVTPGTETTTRALWDKTGQTTDFRVIYNVHEARRAGFAWGTLTATPVVGEEYFGVDWRDDDSVWTLVASITSVVPTRWSWLTKFVVRLRQARAATRLARALAPARQA